MRHVRGIRRLPLGRGLSAGRSSRLGRRAASVCDLARRILRQTCLHTQLLGNLGDHLRRVVGSEDRRLRGQVVGRNSLRCLVDDDEILTRFRMQAVEDGGELEIVRWRKPVEAEVVATLDVGFALRDFSVGMRGVGKSFIRSAPVRRSSARARRQPGGHHRDEQVASQSPSRRMFDHLVDLELVVPCARLQEEVVRQVLDQIP